MYPRLLDGVTVGTFSYKGSSEQHYYVENSDKKRFKVPYQIYREVTHADGTHPLRIPGSALKKLKKEKILTTRRYVFDGIISRFILLPFGKRIARFQPVYRLINAALPFMGALLLAVSIFLKQNCDYCPTGEIRYFPYYLLIVLSLAVHEFAHLISGISYGFRFTEMGVLLLGIFPVGAYVAHIPKKHVRPSARIQFSLAGIEANVLLSAIFLLLSIKPSSLDATFVMAANINLLLAFLNLLPASGLDGEAALSALLGMDSIAEATKRFLRNKTFRRRVLRAGPAGYVCTAVFVLNLISSVLVGLFLICDVVCVGLNLLL